MRTILGCTLAAVLVLVAGFHADARQDKVDAKKIIGKWEPKEQPKGAKLIYEFAKEGKLTLSFTIGDKSEKLDGTYKIDGEKISATLKKGDKEETQNRTIVKLTDAELVTKDEKGMEKTLLRIKE